MMSNLAVCAHGTPAREALWEAIDAAKADDPLAPVTVAAPSVYAGLSLRRSLAARPALPDGPGGSGLVNVRFLALARIAELIGAPALAGAGRRPLTPPLRTEAVRAVVAAEPGAFVAVSSHPATIRSLEGSFRDLRRAPVDAVTGLAGRGDPAASVARLYTAFRERTAAFYDEEDLAEAAAVAVDAGSAALDELGRVVVHLPGRVSPGEGALLDALGRAARLSAVVGQTGDEADDLVGAPVIERLTDALGPAVSQPAPQPAAGTAILSAPDPDDEVRAVLRQVVALADAGTPLHRMAVVYRQADPYARLVREIFDGAGVAWTGPGTRRLADSVAGRVLLAMLALADREFRRDEVAAWMASGPVVDPVEGNPVPAARWDTLSREAGVVGGLDQWRARLDRHARACAADLEAAVATDDAGEALEARFQADEEETRRLAAFVDDLGTRLTPPEPTDWPTMAAWARDLLRVYLGGEGRRRAWPDEELDAARRVDAALDGLAVLAEIRPGTDPVTFLRAVEAELDAPLARVGSFGRGVLVGPLQHAYGADFDVLFVLGMAEGAFPPIAREDPLLPDRDREAVAPGALAPHALRRAEERRDYLAALAASPERVLCFPRADPRAQRKRLPARWLLESAAQLAGETLGAEQLANLPAAPWLHVVPSFEGGVCGDGEPGSVGEHDIRTLRGWQLAGRRVARHPLVAQQPDLRAGVTATDERLSAALTAFDGFVGELAGLQPTPEHPLSPTTLESWAECPFSYLLGRVLRLREVERPEDTEIISPLERGSLMHAVLEEFLDTVEPRTAPTQAWSAAERDLLLAIGEQHCDDAAAAGVTGRPLQWRLERRRILRELEHVLDTDEEVRAELGVIPSPSGREVQFGSGGAGPLIVTLPDGRLVAFRGRIDRVDRAPDGSRVAVFDYKTGAQRPGNPADDLELGTKLQLPVYALAADPGTLGTEVYAGYWYTAGDGVAALSGYDFDADVLAAFHRVLAMILDGVAGGIFPAYPGDSTSDFTGRDTWENCRYCPYDRVCPPGRDHIWERKRDDPAAVTFRRLAEPDEMPA